MQKTMRIMAIIAAVLAACSLMLLLVTIPLQGVIARVFYGYPEDMLKALPQFPLVFLLNCFLRAACMALLIICCGNKKGGIWSELLILGCLVIIIPVINLIVSPLFTEMLGRMGGYEHSIANSVVTRIANGCLLPVSLGQALAYVTCGMSIAFKKMSAKTQDLENKEETSL